MKAFSRAVTPLLLAALFWARSPVARAAEPSAPPTGPITGYVTEEKVIFLTFDDGPFAPWTQQVLDVLAEFEAHGTFFVIGRQAAVDTAILQTIYDGGHGLGNHGYNHANLSGAGRSLFADEIGATAEVLGDLDSHCMRPPYGAVDGNTLPFAAEYGYTVIKWNMDPRDWALPGARAIANHVIQNAKPGSIVVMHDGGGDRSQTVEALRILIPRLQKQGYAFKALCRDVTPEQLVAASTSKLPSTPEPVVTYEITPAPTPTLGLAASAGELRAPRSDLAVAGTPAPEPSLEVTGTAEPSAPGVELTPEVALTPESEVTPDTMAAPATAAPEADAPVYGRITFPRTGTTVRGPILVQGTADHPNFEKWQLDLVLGSGETIFLALGESSLRTINKLMVWDTRLYPNGAAMLRLRIVHDGNYEEYFTHLIVAN